MAGKPLTTEQVTERLVARKLPWCVIEYAGGIYEKSTFACPHGHELVCTLKNVYHNPKCQHCEGNTPEGFNEWLERDGRGYVALEPYQGWDVSIWMQCGKGHEPWKCRPNNIKTGKGCPACALDNMPQCHGMTAIEFQKRLDKDGRGYKLIGELAERNPARSVAHLECPCGNDWWVRPDDIRSGKGCPECSTSGFDPTKPAVLYVAEHELSDGRIRINVGITNRSFKERYSPEDHATVLRVKTFRGAGAEIRAIEQRLLSALSECADERGLGLKKKIGSKECLKADFHLVVETARNLRRDCTVEG